MNVFNDVKFVMKDENYVMKDEDEANNPVEYS